MNPKMFESLADFDTPTPYRKAKLPKLPRHLAWEGEAYFRELSVDFCVRGVRPLTTFEAWLWTQGHAMTSTMARMLYTRFCHNNPCCVGLYTRHGLPVGSVTYSYPRQGIGYHSFLGIGAIPAVLRSKTKLKKFIQDFHLNPPPHIYSPSASFVAEETA